MLATFTARRPLALAGGALAALALGACGSDGRPDASARSVGAGASADYRWLVPVSGPPPSVAEENRQAGTTAWRLPGPAAYVGGRGRGAIDGYVAEQALSPGQIQRIYVRAPGAHSVRIGLFRMGWYGGLGGRQVLASGALALGAQPACRHDRSTGLTRCRWRPTLSFRVPPGLTSGVYIVALRASTGARRDCLFVVRSARPLPLLAQLPTATYEAYNAWGGDSLYPGGSRLVGVTATSQGVRVSYDRPYDSITGAGEFFARDVAMVRFLERYAYPVSYTDSASVDRDPGQLMGHRALLDFGHSEYWSARQEQAWARARDIGTNLLFVSSDTLAWRVRTAPADRYSSEAGSAGHVITAYKEHGASDPDPTAPSGPFPGAGAALTGSAYRGCITPRVAQVGPPAYRYYDWVPAAGLRPAWLFAHSGVSAGSRIAGITGYELDRRTTVSPAGTERVGAGSASCMAAAPGEPAPGPGDDVAETTLYRAPSGALVFATGTLVWELALEPVPSASPDAPRAPDARVVAMTRNLLAHALASPAGGGA